jgi:DNA invertase Pin-like site-specific DNA recombinase
LDKIGAPTWGNNTLEKEEIFDYKYKGKNRLHLSFDKYNRIDYDWRKLKNVKAVGYIRISTNEDKQKYGFSVQRGAIEEYCRKNRLKLIRVYKDTKSGKSLKRPEIQKLLSEKDDFQVVVIFKLDRLSRSVLDLLKLIHEDLQGKDVVFIEEGIDQRTKEGRLFLTQLASFAEYERELIVSRIKDGLAEARKKGVKLGMEPKYPQYSERVKKMRNEGLTWKKICIKLMINYRTAKKAFDDGCR